MNVQPVTPTDVEPRAVPTLVDVCVSSVNAQLASSVARCLPPYCVRLEIKDRIARASMEAAVEKFRATWKVEVDDSSTWDTHMLWFRPLEPQDPPAPSLRDAAQWVCDLYFRSEVAGESWPTAADKAMENLRETLRVVGGES